MHLRRTAGVTFRQGAYPATHLHAEIPPPRPHVSVLRIIMSEDRRSVPDSRRKIRIALMVPELTAIGGLRRVVEFFVRALGALGSYETAVVSLAQIRNSPESVRLLDPLTWFRGVRVANGTWEHGDFLHVGCVFSELEFQRYRPRAALTKILGEYDVIQVVANTPAWALAATRSGRPICLHAATLARLERRSALEKGRGVVGGWRRAMCGLTERLDLRGLRVADATFVMNPHMYQYASSNAPKSRVFLAPPGIDTSFFRPGVYAAGGHILSVGRFQDPRKNVRLLFQSYALLRSMLTHPPALVLVAGTYPTTEDLAFASALGIADSLFLRADVSNEELRRLYQGAALLVLSSDEEGLGLVILEAMACGLPIAATRCGGPDDVISEAGCGRLSPVGSAVDLAASMRDLFTKPGLRAEMGYRGRNYVEARFSEDRAILPFVRVYAELLSGRGGALARSATSSG